MTAVDSDLVRHARRYATQAHERINRQRRYTWQPCAAHLKAVAEIVGSVTPDPASIAAAWLHDIVEDTPATHHDIKDAFGEGGPAGLRCDRHQYAG